MNLLSRNLFAFALFLLVACQTQPQPPVFGDAEKEAIINEVKDQFARQVAAINQLDAASWSDLFSQDQFLSATVGADFYASRTAFVDSLTHYFSMRESQKLEPFAVQVTPLYPDLALMTSQEKAGMVLKGGDSIQNNHVYTIIWGKDPEGWKIRHVHESWVDISAK